MRSLTLALNLSFFLTAGLGVAAQNTYLTATDKHVTPLDTFQDCDVCPEMIVLPLGQFQMGSTVPEAMAAHKRSFTSNNIDYARIEGKLRQGFINLGIDPDQPEEGLLAYYASHRYVREDDPQYFANPMLHEAPAHQVVIDMPIAMGRNEVTREEWAACVADGGCEVGQQVVEPGSYIRCENDADCIPTPDSRIRFRLPNGPHATDPRSPIAGVTYHEMQGYADWLNQKVGADVYRVPTEAEWEYAALAGATTRFAQGDTLSLDHANFSISRRDIVDGEYVWSYSPRNAGELLPVDRLDAANAWGLRHMSGNIGELTSTCGAGPHRRISTSSGYLEADAGNIDCERAFKGGMYAGNMELARPARRVATTSDHWSDWMGFRLVRDLTPITKLTE